MAEKPQIAKPAKIAMILEQTALLSGAIMISPHTGPNLQNIEYIFFMSSH